MKIRRFLGCVCFIYLLTILSSIATAQTTTADIVGTVTDTSGAVLSSATVTVKSEATAASRTAQTSGSGDYTVTLLQVGTYTVTIEAKGFKSSVSHVTLAAGDRARVNASLTVGQTTEVVEVQATTPALQTDSSTIGNLISSQATQDLPLNGRNIIQLVTLQPGVNTSVPSSMSSGNRPDDRRLASNYSANGQTDEVNNNIIDGMDNNERFIGTIGVRPSIDAIQEVKVLTNLYTADLGRTAGGVVELITKSGTNNFHGSAFEFFRNDMFDANTWVPTPNPSRPKAELRQNQFGASIGGPIVKNKTFFFGDYEGFRQRKGVTSVSTVPTNFERDNPGNFSDVGGPVLAGPLDPIGLAYFNLYPRPNGPGTSSNFTYTTARKQDTGTFDVRIDHHFNAANTLFGRYSFNNVNTFTPSNFPDVNGINPGTGPFGSFPGSAKERQQGLGLEYIHVFRPDLLLQLRAGFLRSNIASLALNTGTKNAAVALGFPCTATACVNVDSLTQGIPSLNFDNGYSALGDDAFVPLTTVDNTFQYSGALTYTRGAHNFKFGSQVIRRQLSPTQSSYYRGNLRFTNDVTGNGMANLLIGEAQRIERGNTLIAGQLRAWEPSAYAQDDWHAARWLTLNLGVRYDVFYPYVAHNGAFSNFDPSLGLLVGPTLPGAQHSSSTAGVRADYTDFSPRLGFAATLGNGFVVRGGFGTSYFPGNYAANSVMRNAPFNYSFICGLSSVVGAAQSCNTIAGGTYAGPNGGFRLGAGVPVPVFDITLATNPAKYSTISATPFYQKTSLLKQFSLQIQKDLSGNVVTIGYVGNIGSRLTGQPNINQLSIPVAAGGTYPFPALPAVGIQVQDNSGISRYNAFQSSFTRRTKNGLTASVNYTWSHNVTNVPIVDEGPGQRNNCFGPCRVDNGDGTFHTENSWNQYDYGNADVDIRHRFTTAVSYDLPFGKSMNGVGAQIVKGWAVNGVYSWASGFPFTVQNSNGSRSAINLGNDRPNLVSNPNNGPKTVNAWFNAAAFVPQGAGLLGNEARNQVFGPPQSALSLSVFKTFPIREALNLQFRAESFNLLNKPSFANPNANIGNGAFNKITSTTAGMDQRELQFALKLLF